MKTTTKETNARFATGNFREYLILACIGMTAISMIAAPSLHADVIAKESFDYSNGSISGRTGGTGFDWNQDTKAHTGTASDWDNAYGAPFVSGEKLLTNGGGSQICDREYNGPLEIVGFSYADDQMSAGAIRANFTKDENEVVYYKIEMTRTASTLWSGISSLDFATETIFFGVPTTPAPGGNREFGIEVANSDPSSQEGRTFSGVQPVAGQTYCLVAKIDYGNDLLSLWIDPNLDSPESLSAPLVTRSHTGVNWSTGVRITAGNEATWDNLVIATTWNELKETVVVDNSARKAALKRQIRKYTKKLRKAKRAKKRALVRRFSSKLRKLKRQLRAL